jgi:IS5 family transposase
LRCALLKQHRQLSYEELAFHLEDSASFRAFARLPRWKAKKPVLHMTVSAIRAETWEAINHILLASARQEKVETGMVVRLDSTVTAALMHEPSDSSLLWDAVRLLPPGHSFPKGIPQAGGEMRLPYCCLECKDTKFLTSPLFQLGSHLPVLRLLSGDLH